MWDSITEHILACYPNEACGVIVNNVYIPLENTSENPTNSFAIGSMALLPYLGVIQYIVHSHCRDYRIPEIFDLRTPSFSDIIGQKLSNVPWLIFGTEGKTVGEPLQVPRIPNNIYLNRPFIWYINDCYSLVQDYYQYELGIQLPDHKATEDFAKLRKLSDLFDGYILEYGFTEYTPVGHKYLKGDIILLDNAGFTRNHLGIYEDGYILHQDVLSKRELIEHFIGRIHTVLRYENKNIQRS